MIQRQFVSIFTLSDTEFGREQHHLKRSKFVFRRAIGSFQFFHHTRPEGESIVINARTNAGGQIRVEPRITAGKSSNPIDGFTRQQCSPIHGDSVRHPVSWNGKGWRDLRPDADLVLRFYLQNAEVFAYEIV